MAGRSTGPSARRTGDIPNKEEYPFGLHPRSPTSMPSRESGRQKPGLQIPIRIEFQLHSDSIAPSRKSHGPGAPRLPSESGYRRSFDPDLGRYLGRMPRAASLVSPALESHLLCLSPVAQGPRGLLPLLLPPRQRGGPGSGSNRPSHLRLLSARGPPLPCHPARRSNHVLSRHPPLLPVLPRRRGVNSPGLRKPSVPM